MAHNLSLDQSTSILRLLGDSTRVRLLALLEQEELTVAELVQITQLAQSRVSTHLAKLREATLVRDRRAGVSVFYALNLAGWQSLAPLWGQFRQSLDDAVLTSDAERLKTALAARRSGDNWADSVAGEMQRHYSPGRTFESTARGLLSLINSGCVVDIGAGDGGVAELIAPFVEQLICVDISDKVISAGKKRLASVCNVEFRLGDMHAVPVEDEQADVALLLHTLTYSKQPELALQEAARILKPGGRCVIVTLKEHQYRDVVSPYDHVNLGFSPKRLTSLCQAAGLQVRYCQITERENRTPHFEVLTLLAEKPATAVMKPT